MRERSPWDPHRRAQHATNTKSISIIGPPILKSGQDGFDRGMRPSELMVVALVVALVVPGLEAHARAPARAHSWWSTMSLNGPLKVGVVPAPRGPFSFHESAWIQHPEDRQ